MNGRPALVAYTNARNGTIHVGYADRPYIGGFYHGVIPLCRADPNMERSLYRRLINSYHEVEVAYGGRANCLLCRAAVRRLHGSMAAAPERPLFRQALQLETPSGA
jgi:hypothetical protein